MCLKTIRSFKEKAPVIKSKASGRGCRKITRRELITLSTAVYAAIAATPVTTWMSIAEESSAAEAKNDTKLSLRDTGALSKASVLYIATIRKDGNQSTAAPVWFTLAPNGRILIQTAPTTWKAKRIRRGSPVIVWIGKSQGPAFIGKAQITKDPALSHQIVEDYPKRYLMARLGLHRPTQEMFDKGQLLSIVITPVRALPEGYKSQPGTPAPSQG